MKKQTTPEAIDLETQREAIVNRPYNLAGTINLVNRERYKITPSSIELVEQSTIPALLKLFMESLDNPIDVAIKGGCKNIAIKVDNSTITVADDGYGISSAKHANGQLNLYNAMCEYNSSSNYKANKGQGQKGTNGIGIKLCTTLSTYFKAVSDDGKKVTTVIATDNNLNHKVSQKKTTGKKGTTISFKPDFEIFDGLDEIDQEHIDRMYEYTLVQALTYPNINFKFNGRVVKQTPRQFIKLLGEDAVIEQTDDYFFAVLPNELDDFRQISFVNGLETWESGSHITVIVDEIVKGVREKLIKKYKTIKIGDIRNKLQFVLIAKNMKHIAWEGQTKSKISSSPKQVREYYAKTDIPAFIAKVLKSNEIVEPITEFFKLKEELKKQKELSALDKPQKKRIKSEKYLPATRIKKYLCVTEGASATGGLLPVLGREECGFYELKGKPLNAYNAVSSKFTGNKELSELYQIAKNEGYQYLIYATDQDLDGIHIRGLLTGFIERYLPELKGSVGILNTPVIIVMKNKKPVRWSYTLSDDILIKAGETSKYFKGLGTHTKATLKPVIAKDGLEKMIDILEFDNSEVIDDWLSDKKADKRKEYIMANEFSIAKV